MALVIEDGTGKSNSESYVSVADTQAYAELRGLEFDASDEDAEAALRRATTWIDARYRSGFSGYRVNRRNQSLEWPRHDAYDAADNYVTYNTVPREIVQATEEAAIRELVEPGSLSPDLVTGETMKRVKVGPIEIDYASSSDAYDNRPISTVIDDILSSLLVYSGGSTRISGFTERS